MAGRSPKRSLNLVSSPIKTRQLGPAFLSESLSTASLGCARRDAQPGFVEPGHHEGRGILARSGQGALLRRGLPSFAFLWDLPVLIAVSGTLIHPLHSLKRPYPQALV